MKSDAPFETNVIRAHFLPRFPSYYLQGLFMHLVVVVNIEVADINVMIC